MEMFYPHLTATGPAPPGRVVAETYRRYFYERVADGSLRPLVIPYHLYGLMLPVYYLCIPHTTRPWLYKARWLVWGIIIVFEWKKFWQASSASLGISFVTGFVCIWAIAWSGTWLVFNRPQWESRRVEVRPRRTNEEIVNQRMKIEDESTVTGREAKNSRTEGSETRVRLNANGHTNGHAKDSETGVDPTSELEYYWQGYPDAIGARYFWLLDHIVNFRGPGWNWAIPNLPPPPPAVQRDLGMKPSFESESGVSRFGCQRFDTRRELIRKQAPRFVIGYLLLDICKVFFLKDPYFIFGPTTYDPPAYLQNKPYIIHVLVHELVSCFGIVLALEMVFLLTPILFCLICGTKVLGLRGEPWYYPTTWGSFNNVLNRGLEGLWGGWWHQTFRVAFSAPLRYLIREGYIRKGSRTAQIVGSLFAFGLSGVLHAAGSHSQLPSTYPLHLFLFFMLQAVGIFIQTSICTYFSKQIQDFPSIVRKAGNFAFAASWLLSTGWFLADDFARGGIWLCEPVPISPLRGLGFGDEGDGWWAWGHFGVGWYTGAHWWESGIAI